MKRTIFDNGNRKNQVKIRQNRLSHYCLVKENKKRNEPIFEHVKVCVIRWYICEVKKYYFIGFRYNALRQHRQLPSYVRTVIPCINNNISGKKQYNQQN